MNNTRVRALLGISSVNFLGFFVFGDWLLAKALQRVTFASATPEAIFWEAMPIVGLIATFWATFWTFANIMQTPLTPTETAGQDLMVIAGGFLINVAIGSALCEFLHRVYGGGPSQVMDLADSLLIPTTVSAVVLVSCVTYYLTANRSQPESDTPTTGTAA